MSCHQFPLSRFELVRIKRRRGSTPSQNGNDMAAENLDDTLAFCDPGAWPRAVVEPKTAPTATATSCEKESVVVMRKRTQSVAPARVESASDVAVPRRNTISSTLITTVGGQPRRLSINLPKDAKVSGKESGQRAKRED